MIKHVVCHNCKKNCVLNVVYDGDTLVIQGNQCEKGLQVSESEIKTNKSIFTTLVRIKGASCNVVSVKSSMPIDKNLWIQCSHALSRLYVGAPIKIGDVICKNILNTGVDIICTKNVCKS